MSLFLSGRHVSKNLDKGDAAWNEGYLMPSVAEAPHPKPSPPEVVAQALGSCWKRVEKELRRFRHARDDAETHDLRVALRRLLVAVELAGALDDGLFPAKLERELKGLLGALSPLRDVEIQRQALKERAVPPEAERALKRHLLRREHRDRKTLHRLLDDFPLRRRGEAVAQACVALETEAAHPSPSGRLAVVGAIARRYVVFDRRRRSSHADLEHLHRVRIAFKQYRYAVELGAPLLRPVPEKARDAMKAFQDRLGDLQDSVVMIGLFSREPATQNLVQELELTQRELAERIQAELDAQAGARVPEFSQPLR